MPVLNVTPQERDLIPYRVQALYNLGRITKKQLDEYIKTGSEEALKQYEAQVPLPPASLAGPRPAEPVVVPEVEAPSSTLGAMGLNISARSEQKDVNDEIAAITEESEWWNKIEQASKDDKFRQKILDEAKKKRDDAWERLKQQAASRRDTLPSPTIQKDIEAYKKLTSDLDEATKNPKSVAKKKEDLTKRIEGLRSRTAGIQSQFQAAEKGLSGGTGLARAVAQGVSNWEQYLPQLTGPVGGLVAGGGAVVSGAGAPLAGVAYTGGNVAGSALGTIPLAKRVYNDSFAEVILNGGTSEEAKQYAFEKTALEFGAEMAASLIPGANVPGLRTASKSIIKPVLGKMAGGAGRQIVEENLTDLASQTLDITRLAGGQESAALEQTRLQNLPFDEQGQFDPQKFAEQRYETALAAAVGGTAATAVPAVVQTRAQNADVQNRINQAKIEFNQFASTPGVTDVALETYANGLAAKYKLDLDQVVEAADIAKPKEAPPSVAKSVADTVSIVNKKAVELTQPTGDLAFDAGQAVGQATIQDSVKTAPVLETPVSPVKLPEVETATPIAPKPVEAVVEAPVKPRVRLDEKGQFVPVSAPKVAEDVAAEVEQQVKKSPKPVSPRTVAKQRARIETVAELAEQELVYSGQLEGLDEKASTAAVRTKTLEYLNSDIKTDDLKVKISDLRTQAEQQQTTRTQEVGTRLAALSDTSKKLAKTLGQDTADALVANDQVRVLSTFDGLEVDGQKADNTAGFFRAKDGKLYLNSAQIGKPENKAQLAEAVLNHEFGHKLQSEERRGAVRGLVRDLFGDAGITSLVGEIKTRSQGTGRIAQIAKRAVDRAQVNVDKNLAENIDDEVVQYFIEELTTSYDGPLGTLRKYIDTAVTKTRQVLSKNGIKKLDIRPQDIGYIIRSEVKADSKKTTTQKGEGKPEFSLGAKGATGFDEAKKTGKTFQSKAVGQEVFEIPDYGAKVYAGLLRQGNTVKLGDVLLHPELFKNWPFLKDVKIVATDKHKLNHAMFDPDTKTIEVSRQNVDNVFNFNLSDDVRKEAQTDLTKTTLHEITHAIQQQLGVEMGSNPTFETYRYVMDKLRALPDAQVAAKYAKVLTAVRRNKKNVEKLFTAIQQLRESYDAQGRPWPKSYAELDKHITDDPALAGSIMPFVKGLGLQSTKDLHEAYNFIRQADNAGYWNYMGNRGEVTARAVESVFSGKYKTLEEAETEIAKQFGVLGTAKDTTALTEEFEKKPKEERVKPKVLMSVSERKVEKPKTTLTDKMKKAEKMTISGLENIGVFDKRPEKLRIAIEASVGNVVFFEQKANELVRQLSDALKKDGVSLAAADKAWKQAVQKGQRIPDFGSKKAQHALQDLRDEIDLLTQEIIRAYDAAGVPLDEKLRKTLKTNLYSYISRSYDINYDKQYGEKLLKAAENDPVKAKVINDLRQHFKDNTLQDLKQVDLLDDKDLRELHAQLIGDSKAKLTKKTKALTRDTRQRFIKDLKNFRGNLNEQELLDVLQNDFLRIGKVSNLATYYRGAARDEGILKRKKSIPEVLRAAMGERTGAIQSAMTTIVRQAKLLAETKMFADFLRLEPELFSEQRTTENSVRIDSNQSKYGPLAGRYTTSDMAEFIESRVKIHQDTDTLLFNLHDGYARDVLISRAIQKGFSGLSKLAAGYKAWTVLTNVMNYAYNVASSAVTATRNSAVGMAFGTDYIDSKGKKIPMSTWIQDVTKDFLAGTVTKETSEIYGYALKNGAVGSAVSGDIREAFVETIRDSAMGKRPGLVKSAGRKVVSVADAAFGGPEALANAIGAVVESNYFRQLWDAQGKKYTHEQLMQAAFDKVKQTSISRDRAIKLAKLIDQTSLMMFATFFTETMRAPLQSAHQAITRDILPAMRSKSMSPKEKAIHAKHGLAHLGGLAAAVGVTELMMRAAAGLFGSPFGDDDDEDKEGLDEEYQSRLSDLVVMGTDEEGRKMVYDVSKLNTYSALWNPTLLAAKGDWEGAAEQVTSLMFMNTLLSKVIERFENAEYGKKATNDAQVWLNNQIAKGEIGDVRLSDTLTPDRVNTLTDFIKMTFPGIAKDAYRGLTEENVMEKSYGAALVGLGARPFAYDPAATFRFRTGDEQKALEEARNKLNNRMREKGVSEDQLRQEIERYYRAEQELIVRTRPRVRAALKNNATAKQAKELLKIMGVNKHIYEQIMSDKPYKPTEMSKNWLKLSEKIATFGKPPEVKDETGQIYTDNKAMYKKIFDNLYKGDQ